MYPHDKLYLVRCQIFGINELSLEDLCIYLIIEASFHFLARVCKSKQAKEEGNWVGRWNKLVYDTILLAVFITLLFPKEREMCEIICCVWVSMCVRYCTVEIGGHVKMRLERKKDYVKCTNLDQFLSDTMFTGESM